MTKVDEAIIKKGKGDEQTTGNRTRLLGYKRCYCTKFDPNNVLEFTPNPKWSLREETLDKLKPRQNQL